MIEGPCRSKLDCPCTTSLPAAQNPLPRHRFNSRRAALALRPQLHQEIVCTATYYDACISYPERLTLELVLDAEQQCRDVHALNYVRAIGTNGETVVLADEVSGQSFEIKPKIVINASGAWIDFTNHALQRETQYIGGTKGSHIVIDHPELLLATQGQMLYFENRGRTYLHLLSRLREGHRRLNGHSRF